MLRARRQDRERGASLVEFALVVPLLTLFLFGIVQFGIAYDKQQSINSAAREAARLSSLPTTTFEEAVVRARATADNTAAAGAGFKVVLKDDGGNVHGVFCSYTGPGLADVYRSADDCDPVGPAPQSQTMSAADRQDATKTPCGEDPSGTDGNPATPSDFVRLEVETPYDITIPFVGVQSVTIDSEAEFRCE